MRIFAIRDRLIDYFLTPFAAPGEKEVMASVSAVINREDNQDAIAQAPHHFEIWQLGIVTEDGHIEPERQLVADCTSLIRRSVRERGAGGSGQTAVQGPESSMPGPPGNPGAGTNAGQRAPQSASQAEVSPRAEIAPGSGRLD